MTPRPSVYHAPDYSRECERCMTETAPMFPLLTAPEGDRRDARVS